MPPHGNRLVAQRKSRWGFFGGRGPVAARVKRCWWPCGSGWSTEEAESKRGLEEGRVFSPSPQWLEGTPTLGFPVDLIVFSRFGWSWFSHGVLYPCIPTTRLVNHEQFVLFFLIRKERENFFSWHCHLWWPHTKDLTTVLYGFPTPPSTWRCLFFFKHGCLQQANKNCRSFNTAICLPKASKPFFPQAFFESVQPANSHAKPRCALRRAK